MNTLIKTKLKEQEAELQTRLYAVNSDLRKEVSADFAEQATERENEEVLQGLQVEIEHELVLVRKALHRLDTGEYGLCVECGKAIGEQRLHALPHANTCILCAT